MNILNAIFLNVGKSNQVSLTICTNNAMIDTTGVFRKNLQGGGFFFSARLGWKRERKKTHILHHYFRKLWIFLITW